MAILTRRAACLFLFLTCTTAAAPGGDQRLKVAFVVWDGMELIESTGPGHVFSFAPGMDEFTVSATRDPIRSEFYTLVPEYTFADCPQPDVIVIPGGNIWTPMTGEPFRAWLKDQVPRSTLTLTVCNGAVLLADLGLLDGRKATCGPSNLDDLMLLGKDVQAYANRRWVHDGNVITSQSYLGGLDAAFYAVQVLRGDEGIQQVLRWSNYRVDFPQFAREHAEPGVVPTSRRREIVAILQREGIDAAVRRYREWVESGEPAYSPPLDTMNENDMFQWMAWGNQRLGRHDLSLQICEFKTRIWPESAKERAYLGEALMKAGRLDPALERLLEALELDHECRPAIVFLRELVSRPDCPAGDPYLRAKSILAGLDATDAPSPDAGKHSTSLPRVTGQEPIVGGPCEGCEAVFQGVPDDCPTRARIASAREPGEPLRIVGQVVDRSGAPVPGTIVYAYHTNVHGIYPPNKQFPGQAAYRHGTLRGWARADSEGRYQFDTIRPGGYPESTQPQHVHMHVIEPGRCTYYIDSIHFLDDPRLTPAQRHAHSEGRGGSGMVTPRRDDAGTWLVERNIVLGAAIPDYPARSVERAANQK